MAGASKSAGEPADEREAWGSRASFVLSCIGSAVGLGNFFRFPFLVYGWGGGAFFVPYLLALFFVGIPLLAAELGLGQLTQSGAIDAYRAIHWRLGGIGVCGAIAAFTIVSYYAVILAWSLVYLVESFESTLPWSFDPNDPDTFFIGEQHFNETLMLRPNLDGSDLISSRVSAA